MERHNITVKQLECLIAIDQTSHFRRAAELLNIQQPTLSQQLQNLETILGSKLVERSRSGVSLTPTGREILKLSQNVLDTLQEMTDFATSSQNELVGTIRLGTTPTIGPYFLPFVVKVLHKSHKALDLYVRESAARDLEYELSKGTHDLVLTQFTSPSDDHHNEVLFQEPLYLALALDHPLANQDDIRAAQLKGQDILSLSPKYHFHDQIRRICENFGATLIRDYEGTSLDAVRHMVGMGMGVTFLPALYVHSEIRARSEIVVKRIKDRAISRPIGLAWRRKSGNTAAYMKIATIMRDIAGAKFADLVDMQH